MNIFKKINRTYSNANAQTNEKAGQDDHGNNQSQGRKNEIVRRTTGYGAGGYNLMSSDKVAKAEKIVRRKI